MSPRNTEAYKEHRREYMRAWRKSNPEAARRADRNNRLRHPERIARSKNSAYERDKDTYVVRARNHQLKKITPAWANKEKIKEFYVWARKVSKQTGIKHSVDHILPIKSDFVCGLHCEFNLQVLPLADNIRKHNKVGP